MKFRTASLERILGDKAEQYFRTMERTFYIAEQKEKLKSARGERTESQNSDKYNLREPGSKLDQLYSQPTLESVQESKHE